MGFMFGLANELDPSISLYCFIGVVFFLICFDYITGVLEFFLEKSPLYNRMLQLIYKELMLMGLVSFVVIMYEANASHASATETAADDLHGSNITEHRYLSAAAGEEMSQQEKIIISIDFAHILLFYITLFFVVHAFYLMGMSIFIEKRYHQLAAEDLDSLAERVEQNSKNPIKKFLFEFSYWPFSTLRSHVEFHLLRDFFQKTYLLSVNFDFAAYLSHSFGRYALKTINRSLFSWAVFLLVIVVNYCRIAAGFSCHGVADTTDPLFHEIINCDNYAIRLFLFSGVLLASYFLILLFVSTHYRKKLISLGTTRSTAEYLAFLQQKVEEQEEEGKDNQYLQEFERYQNKELKMVIEHELHSKEHGEEENDEPEVRFLAGLLSSTIKYSSETISFLRLQIKLFLTKIFCRERLTRRNREASIFKDMSFKTKIEKKDKAVLLIHERRRSSVTRPSLNQLHGNNPQPAGNPQGSPGLFRGRSFIRQAPPKEEKFSTQIKRKAELPLKYKISVQFLHSLQQRQQNALAPGKGTSSETRGVESTESSNSNGVLSSIFNFFTQTKNKINQVIPSELLGKNTEQEQLKSLDYHTNQLIAQFENKIHSIFLFNNPALYFRAVEISLLLNCFYTAAWATNMISIMDDAEFSVAWTRWIHIFMVLPIIWGFYCIGLISEISSMIICMSDINFVVIHEVLVQMELTQDIVRDLRKGFRITMAEYGHPEEEFVVNIFNEIDADGSGFIDRDEFRELLRKLHLTFSNYRFKLLYRAIDEANDGLISLDDFKAFILGEIEEKNISPAAAGGMSERDFFGRSRVNSEEIVRQEMAQAQAQAQKQQGNTPSSPVIVQATPFGVSSSLIKNELLSPPINSNGIPLSTAGAFVSISSKGIPEQKDDEANKNTNNTNALFGRKSLDTIGLLQQEFERDEPELIELRQGNLTNAEALNDGLAMDNDEEAMDEGPSEL